jgi:hypothetical protein
MNLDADRTCAVCAVWMSKVPAGAGFDLRVRAGRGTETPHPRGIASYPVGAGSVRQSQTAAQPHRLYQIPRLDLPQRRHDRGSDPTGCAENNAARPQSAEKWHYFWIAKRINYCDIETSGIWDPGKSAKKCQKVPFFRGPTTQPIPAVAAMPGTGTRLTRKEVDNRHD